MVAYAAGMTQASMALDEPPQQTAAATTTVAAQANDLPEFGLNLNINGAVGLPLNPTANIPRRRSVRIQGGYFDLGEADIAFEGFPEFSHHYGDLKFYGLHVAGRLWSAPLEISGGVEKLRARGRLISQEFGAFASFPGLDKTSFTLGAKYQLWHNKTGDTFAAIGAGYSRALFHNWHAYIVGTHISRTAKRRIVTHLGLRYDRFKFGYRYTEPGFEADPGDKSKQASIFGGVEVPIDSRGRWALVGEVQTKNADNFDLLPDGNERLRPKFPYSLSIRLQASRGLTASVGVLRQGITPNSGIFTQVGYTFD